MSQTKEVAVAVAQPMPVATAVAVPIQATPVAVAMPMSTPAGSDFIAGVGYAPAVPKGQWQSELCSCGAAGGDMCCVVCCCPFVVAPQLYEKVLGKKGSCIKWFGVLLVLYLVRQLSDTMLRTSQPGEVRLPPHWPRAAPVDGHPRL